MELQTGRLTETGSSCIQGFFPSRGIPSEIEFMRKNTISGRPAYFASASLRKRVSVAASSGLSHDAIAIQVGVSRNTLEKHFRLELHQAACVRKIEIFEAIHRAGKNGNVAAIKEYLRRPVEKLPRAKYSHIFAVRDQPR